MTPLSSSPIAAADAGAAPADTAADSAADAWARVYAGDVVTRYRRRGSGAPVVGLCDDGAPDARWQPLVDALAAHHRALLPEQPGDVADFAAWLAGFVDGVGAAPVALVAFGRCAAAALAFARTDGGRLDRLVLLPSADDAPTLRRAVADTGGQDAVPLLLLGPDDAGDPVARVLAFLQAAAPG